MSVRTASARRLVSVTLLDELVLWKGRWLGQNVLNVVILKVGFDITVWNGKHDGVGVLNSPFLEETFGTSNTGS